MIDEILTRVWAELKANREELAALRALLQPEKPQNPTDFDHLLREIKRASRGLPFHSADVIDTALIEVEQHGDSRLVDAIVVAAGSLNSFKLGRLFAELEGRGLRRIRHDRDGQVWKCDDEKTHRHGNTSTAEE